MAKLEAEIDVVKEIEIHLTSLSKKLGWAHTHGMAKFGLPELEIRYSPMLLGRSAGAILNHVCHHMLNSGEPLELGTSVTLEKVIQFKLVKAEPIAGYADHYAVERWQLVDLPSKDVSHIPSWEPKA